MTPTLLTLFYFGALIVGTLVFYRIACYDSNTQAAQISPFSKVLGALLLFGAVVSFALYDTDEILGVEILGVLYSLVTCLNMFFIELFFMRLRKVSKEFSLASVLGIAGSTAYIFGCGMMVVFCEIISLDYDIYTYIHDLSTTFMDWSSYLLLAAVGIICGTVYSAHKTARIACLILIACQILGPTLSIMSPEFLHQSGDFDTNLTIVKLLQHIPMAAWIIFLSMFNLDTPSYKPTQADTY